jgi:hypothetical protein
MRFTLFSCRPHSAEEGEKEECGDRQSGEIRGIVITFRGTIVELLVEGAVRGRRGRWTYGVGCGRRLAGGVCRAIDGRGSRYEIPGMMLLEEGGCWEEELEIEGLRV